VVISWIVIWGTVAFIAAAPYLLKHERVTESRNIQLRFAGRYAVGLKALSPQMFASGGSSKQFEDLVRQAASSPADQLHAIAIVAELEGVEAAKKSLDRFEATNASPELIPDARLLRTIYEKGPDALDQGQKKGLVQRHEWFGQLAISFGQSDNSPVRRAAVAPAQRVIIAAIVLFIVGGFAFLLGLGLFIWFLVKLLSSPRTAVAPPLQPMWGQPMPYAVGQSLQYGHVEGGGEPVRMYYTPDPDAPPVFLQSFAIYLGGFLAMGIAVELLLPKAGLGPKVLAPLIPLIAAILWPRFRGMTWAQIRRALGWHRGKGIAIEVVSGVAGYLAALPILALAIILMVFLTRLSGGKGPSHPIVNEISADFWSAIKLYLLASVWAPITEELLFRGALFHHLRRRHGWWISTAIVSFIFAAIHPQGYLGIPVLMTIAFLMAALREWRGSLIAPMVFHAVNNFVAITIVVFMMG
jgi:membrane protease YdiL (CAAX protease family)